ncbi:MAG: hypothetical protein QOJ29_3261 [Thermoleophilaceae bacterium]|nr:hypothetical protein [Thermoleophilaceae bacterium]
MIFRQLTHDDLGCASYFVGDDDAGVAAVIDPRLDVDEYLRLARYLGVRIEHVLETHNHADHVSGHGRLLAATGATLHIHRLAEPDYAHEPFDDGWQLELGSLRIEAIHAPGHRPEHTCFALTDSARGEQPWAVLTGDALFVGDIGRPDLAVEKEEGARELFRSLHRRLLTLPDTTEVWPGHLGGSLCGGPGMDLKTSSTIGYERAAQPLLAIESEDEFVERSTSALAPQPPNFRAIVERNRGALRAEHFERMRDGAIMCNAGHFDVEIDLPALTGERREVRPQVEEIRMDDGRRLYLLAQGRVVNLAAAEGHPAAVMDVIFSCQALAAEALVRDRATLAPGVQPLPESIDREVARLKLDSMGIELDELTEAQRAYLSSWR